MKTRKYTNQQLTDAVKNSQSIRQVLAKIGLVEAGGNYQSVTKQIKTLNLDTSHFHGMSWRKGSCVPPKKAKPLSEILCKDSLYRTSLLRERLIIEGYKTHECENCNAIEWLGNPIPLELHHINGDPKDNRLENLQLRCPNCHALTDNYRGKAIKKV